MKLTKLANKVGIFVDGCPDLPQEIDITNSAAQNIEFIRRETRLDDEFEGYQLFDTVNSSEIFIGSYN